MARWPDDPMARFWIHLLPAGGGHHQDHKRRLTGTLNSTIGHSPSCWLMSGSGCWPLSDRRRSRSRRVETCKGLTRQAEPLKSQCFTTFAKCQANKMASFLRLRSWDRRCPQENLVAQPLSAVRLSVGARLVERKNKELASTENPM